jgi:hypothetical protein
MRTLCDGTRFDEVGETFSAVFVIGGEPLGTIVDDSTVGIPEPCPTGWLDASSTAMLRIGALCFKRISLAVNESHDESSSRKITTHQWYMYTSDLLQWLLYWWVSCLQG